jgi:hypothetical protein
MMNTNTRKTPQQKKRESYNRDRRNTYGENSVASRKGIARKKRHQNRAERRLAHQAFVPGASEIDLERLDLFEARRLLLHRKVHRLKWPDEPLGVVLRRKFETLVSCGIMPAEKAEWKIARIRKVTRH